MFRSKNLLSYVQYMLTCMMPIQNEDENICLWLLFSHVTEQLLIRRLKWIKVHIDFLPILNKAQPMINNSAFLFG